MADNIKGHTLDDSSSLLSEKDRSRSLRASVWDGCFYSGMAGTGESYLIPLMEAIGATNTQVGIFAAIPQLFVAFAQFIAIWVIENVRRRRRIIVAGALIQALMLGFIAVLLIFNKQNPWILMVVASVYFAANGIAIPAWNSLLGDITQGIDRGKYFGSRNGLCQIVLFLALVSAGLTLQHFDNLSIPLKGFILIMIAAMLFRIGSALFLWQHYGVPYQKVEGAYFSFRAFVARTRYSNFAKFTFMVAAMSFAVGISQPFFAIYLLRDMGLSYLQFTIAMGIIVAVQYLMMKQWGTFTDKFGNRAVQRISGLILPFQPILWLSAKTFEHIIYISIIGGIAWAGYNLSIGNFIFDAVSSEKRARCSAYMNFFICIGIFLGALTGAFLVSHAPESVGVGTFRMHFFSDLQFAFLISGIMRLLVQISFWGVVKEVRDVECPKAKDIVMVFTHILPLSGSRFEPILKSGKDTLNNIFKKK